MDVQRRPPPAPRPDGGRVAVGAIVVLLVLVVASLAARGADWTSPAPPTPSTQTAPAPPAVGSTAATHSAPRPPQRENSPLPPFRPPTWVLVAVLAVLGAAVLAGTARYVRFPRWSLRRALRPKGEPPAEPTGFAEPDRRSLAEAADRALAEVDQPDAREAVIRSWLMLGEAAAQAGVAPHPAETATEYAARVATEFYVPAPMLARLAELYREARFSHHEVTGRDRAAARQLLERLSEDLEHGRR
jgi:hypothetical protein